MMNTTTYNDANTELFIMADQLTKAIEAENDAFQAEKIEKEKLFEQKLYDKLLKKKFRRK